MEFYIIINNIKKGPFSLEELSSQNITPTTMVWSVGFSNWKQAKEVPALTELLSNLPPEIPTVEIMPKTWLIESILVTCFCCLPFGILGILSSNKIADLYHSGKYEQAQYQSKEARKWVLWGFFCGLGATVFYLICMIFYIAVLGLSL